jgi:magnesium transporter
LGFLSGRPIPDEDLAGMYLSDKKNDVSRSREDHDDLEVLLESFAKQVEEIVNEADTMAVSSPSAV